MAKYYAAEDDSYVSNLSEVIGRRDEETCLIGKEELTQHASLSRPALRAQPWWRRRRARALLVFCLCLFALLALPSFVNTKRRRSRSVWSDGDACGQVDFSCQAQTAMDAMARIEQRQSTTLDEAIQHYRLRYDRDPPAGFAQWYAFATANNATLIDEYDRIELDLAPFRRAKLTSTQWYDRMAKAWGSNRNAAMPREALNSITVVNGTLQLAYANDILRKLLEPVVYALPDLTIFWNSFDEPRVILPDDEESAADEESKTVVWQDLAWSSTWDALRRPCARLRRELGKSTIRMPSDRYKDICAMSEAQRYSHGFFNAPANYQPTTTLIPVLSVAKMSTMGDIAAPPTFYFNSWYRGDAVDDIPFADKTRSVYWRGTSTGMMMMNRHWMQGHRQRFVMHMQHLEEAAVAAKKALSSAVERAKQQLWPMWITRKSRFGKLAIEQLARFEEYFANVAFSSISYCDDVTCGEAKSKLPVWPADAHTASFAHQIVADLDGNSMSGRFYRLLASNSLPLKQSVWHEWHDGRIVPWVHYVPLSLDLTELRPLLLWLLTTEEGQQYGERIAEQGSKHLQTSFREVDATIYLYRLLLEWGSLLR